MTNKSRIYLFSYHSRRWSRTQQYCTRRRERRKNSHHLKQRYLVETQKRRRPIRYGFSHDRALTHTHIVTQHNNEHYARVACHVQCCVRTVVQDRAGRLGRARSFPLRTVRRHRFRSGGGSGCSSVLPLRHLHRRYSK